jgi:protein-disulfide isomerase
MDFLTQKGVSFISKDIANDPQAFEEMAQLGAGGTPTIVVDGQVVVGFNPRRLEALIT